MPARGRQLSQLLPIPNVSHAFLAHGRHLSARIPLLIAQPAMLGSTAALVRHLAQTAQLEVSPLFTEPPRAIPGQLAMWATMPLCRHQVSAMSFVRKSMHALIFLAQYSVLGAPTFLLLMVTVTKDECAGHATQDTPLLEILA